MFADKSEASGKDTRESDDLVTIFATKNNYFVCHCVDDGYARLIRQPQKELFAGKERGDARRDQAALGS
jgi:hypothetical protein